MPSRSRRRSVRLTIVAVGVVAVAGCSEAGTPADVETVRAGLPSDVSPEQDVTVVPGDDAREVLVITLGSSSCPLIPTTADWDAEDGVLRLQLGLGPDASEPCTADATYTTAVLRLPADAPDAAGLEVVVDDLELVVGDSPSPTDPG